MRLVNRAALLVVVASLFAGCAGGGRSVPMSAPAADTPRFSVPASLSLAVPARPPAFTPAQPPGRGTRTTVRSTSAAHASFFAGEAPLSNGVYYLALPNGNPFGYYSYLADSNYIFHFDAGYEYVLDANDGAGGVYLYDFTSGHWWYTGRNYPFPYIYDFSLGAFLYYYPNTNSAGHYTTNSRYFYNFTASAIIALPDPNGTAPLSETVAGAMGFVHPESHKTLYYLDVDTATGGTCTAGCLSAWPPLTPTSGAQSTVDFTMAARTDGTGQQWDYQGHPLYNYVGDSGPDQVNGDNIPDFGGHWHVARPASAATSPPTSTPTDPPTKCPGGYC
jgi:predicted lipoprotein with Yx(FWY)xxD motif